MRTSTADVMLVVDAGKLLELKMELEILISKTIEKFLIDNEREVPR